MEHVVVIEPCSTEGQIDEVRGLASSTGMEEDEIDEMMKEDKVFLATKEESIIGFVALRSKKSPKYLEVVGLAIVEDQRRSGYASLLLKHAEGFAHECRSEQLIVRTSNDNIPALAFYQERGFKIRKVELGSMVTHHGGKEILGWKRIPVRDQVILEKNIA